MKHTTKIMLVLLMIFGFGFTSNHKLWNKQTGINVDSSITTLENDSNHDLIVGTENSLWFTSSISHSPELINLPQGHQTINDISMDSAQAIYVATSKGVFVSEDHGRHWKSVFTDSRDEPTLYQTIQANEKVLLLGTNRGLYIKEQGQSNWSRQNGALKDQSIEEIILTDQFAYLASPNEMFSLELNGFQAKSIKRFGSLSEDELDDGPSMIKSMTFNDDQQILYVVHRFGLTSFDMKNQQETPIISSGINFNDVTDSILLGSDQHFILICSGLNVLALNLADEHRNLIDLSSQLEGRQIRYLLRADQETIWLATDQSVYQANEQLIENEIQSRRSQLTSMEKIDMKTMFAHEPGIEKVHQWAVEYADVHPDKVESWRRLSKRRAWLPDVSIGLDHGQDWNRSDTIYGSSSGGGATHIGPDDKSYGSDMGVDLNLSWDLGDLVWSTDQTTIDSRSKLMVELREEILDQVTRLYFERRRLQVETLNHQIDTDGIHQQLRIDELTALLDAYTDGEFSSHFKRPQTKERTNDYDADHGH